MTDTNKITQPPEIVNCGTDEEAIGHAKQLLDGRALEVCEEPIELSGFAHDANDRLRASDQTQKMKYVAIGFVLVFVPGVLVALVWGFAHGVIPDSAAR